MELVDGPSLKQVIDKRKRIEERRALEIAREVTEALEAIDRAGMIHRDIKPDNILLTSTGGVKVADLGLARVSERDAGMTQMGQAVGTPHYMAPEQVRGEADVDIRADLYALGATLFHMVTGRPPFTGSCNVEIMTSHLKNPVPMANEVNPNVSPECAKLIAKLMEKKREDREQTPQKLRKRIDAMLVGSTVVDQTPLASPQPVPRAHAHGSKAAPGKHEAKSHAQQSLPRVAPQRPGELTKRTNWIVSGVAGIVIIVGLIVVCMDGKSAPAPSGVSPSPTPLVPAQGETRPAPSQVNTNAKTSKAPEVDAPPAVTSPASGFDITGGEDIHESIARGKLDETERLNKAGKLTPAELQARYRELTESSLHGTRAATEAAVRLKKLPPLPPSPVAATTANSNAKGVWWEGEDAFDHNFVAHPWLDQIEKQNLSSGKYLNQLNDEKWIRMQGKTPTNKLHANYTVDVPADGTYTLWVREYDPWCGVTWQFKWDEGRWYSVSNDYPFENKIEIGKDRWMVWRNYAGQTLTKGKHTFHLEAAIEGRHQTAGFDCFYLTTEPFKPEGPKKPQG